VVTSGNIPYLYVMENALSLVCTLLAGFLLSTSSFAQSSGPYNPDSNGDGLITVVDLQAFLSTYGLAFEATSTEWSCGEAITYSGVGYSTVQIGDQCWFAENLSTTTYLDGDTIPQNLSNGDWSITASGAMAFYNDVPTNSGLYNWYAVDDARGLCPSGWHIPTDGEWTEMTDLLGGQDVAGGQMKATYGWLYDGNGSNSSGFTGLPGGARSPDVDFESAGSGGAWWSSSPNESDVWYRFLGSEYEGVYRGSGNLHYGFSVRCVRDVE
tara:strand:+ start:180 stop:983 length:804 start_codon:yes stop_codon:yes gene_type:complete